MQGLTELIIQLLMLFKCVDVSLILLATIRICRKEILLLKLEEIKMWLLFVFDLKCNVRKYSNLLNFILLSYLYPKKSNALNYQEFSSTTLFFTFSYFYSIPGRPTINFHIAHSFEC